MFKVFVCYSHTDAVFLERIRVHLKPLVGSQGLLLWSDQRIQSGDHWRDEIRSNLETADAAIVLTSPDALASDFIVEQELPLIASQHFDWGTPVFVINCRSSLAARHDFLSEIQWVNPPERPLAELSDAQIDSLLAIFAGELSDRISALAGSHDDPSELATSGAQPTQDSASPTLVSESHFKNQTIDLCAVASNLMSKGLPTVLEGYYFENCALQGPIGIIAQNTFFDGMTFEAPVGPDGQPLLDALFLRTNHEQTHGCLTLKSCTVLSCTTTNVAIVGDDDFISKFKTTFSVSSQ